MNIPMDDPMVWYGVAFLAFCFLAYRYARKPILNWLDSEIIKISDELAEALQLRVDAEATLSEYKKKHAEAMAEANSIIASAKEEAVRLKQQAETDLKNALTRHEQQAGERIRMAESEAIAAVRIAAVDLAMEMARQKIGEQGDRANALTDHAIAELPALAAEKARAA